MKEILIPHSQSEHCLKLNPDIPPASDKPTKKIKLLSLQTLSCESGSGKKKCINQNEKIHEDSNETCDLSVPPKKIIYLTIYLFIYF